MGGVTAESLVVLMEWITTGLIPALSLGVCHWQNHVVSDS